MHRPLFALIVFFTLSSAGCSVINDQSYRPDSALYSVNITTPYEVQSLASQIKLEKKGEPAWKTENICDPANDCADTSIALAYVEINDKGTLHKPDQLVAMAQLLRSRPAQDVVIYIHGWRHDADFTDTNAIAFRHFLNIMAKNTGRQTTGIYVGWRGDSLKGLGFFTDIPSIYTRKKVAQTTVGPMGLTEILTSVSTTVPQETRIAVIGHSLGGAALLAAMKQLLDDADKKFESGKDSTISNIDLALMINPAASSADFRKANVGRLDRWKREKNHPKLMVMQAKADVPVGVAFPLAMGLQQAVGFNQRLRTHDQNVNCSLRCTGKQCVQCPPLKEPLYDYYPLRLYFHHTGYEFWARGTSTSERTAHYNEPAWVVLTDGSCMTSHGNIFNTHLAVMLPHLMDLDLPESGYGSGR